MKSGTIPIKEQKELSYNKRETTFIPVKKQMRVQFLGGSKTVEQLEKALPLIAVNLALACGSTYGSAPR